MNARNLWTSAMAALCVSLGIGQAFGVLIDQPDYSDSFTLSANGGIAGRGTQFPVGSPGINVEDNHGNPAQVWTNSMWSISADNIVSPGGVGYPGTSGNGSATGMTQTGGASHWGIEYGLRTDFVVQSDLVQTGDRINVTAGAARDTIGDAGNLSVFFRRTGHANPEIGIYNSTVGERDSGLSSGIPTASAWHNYAVRFNRDNNELWIYTDENLRGVVHLDTFDGGSFAGFTSNASVGVGGYNDDRTWSDNFMVGSSDALVQTAFERGTTGFDNLQTITGPSATDYADVGSGNGVTFTLVPGFDALHVAGASDTLDLNDGVAIEAPANSDTFLPPDGASEVRVLIDLNGLVKVTDVNTFGTTTSHGARSYQNYALYGSDSPTLLSTIGDPLADGWSLIADIESDATDTTYSEYGVNISNINEKFRQMLWVVTPHPNVTFSSHYVEFDVHVVPEPSSMALAGLGLIVLCGFGWRRRRSR